MNKQEQARILKIIDSLDRLDNHLDLIDREELKSKIQELENDGWACEK